MHSDRRPKIILTLGDAAGIGPEVTLKALGHFKGRNDACVVIVGPANYFDRLARKLRLGLTFHACEDPRSLLCPKNRIACYFPWSFPKKIVLGKSCQELSRAAMASITEATRLAMDGQADAVVTAPINKAGVQEAGFNIPGHTEYMAELSGTRRYEMMLVGEALRVVPVTRHVPLKKVPELLSIRRIEQAILLTAHELTHLFGIPRPRIAVCALNPHAGERGKIGREEIEMIDPAIRSARKKVRAKVLGPVSPDALFREAYLGRYDAEICMYHDQGLIPLKMVARDSGVNITLGLPFIRTSPDHGTGYDIASRSIAHPGSMIHSIELAIHLAKNRLGHELSRRRS